MTIHIAILYVSVYTVGCRRFRVAQPSAVDTINGKTSPLKLFPSTYLCVYVNARASVDSEQIESSVFLFCFMSQSVATKSGSRIRFSICSLLSSDEIRINKLVAIKWNISEYHLRLALRVCECFCATTQWKIVHKVSIFDCRMCAYVYPVPLL